MFLSVLGCLASVLSACNEFPVHTTCLLISSLLSPNLKSFLGEMFPDLPDSMRPFCHMHSLLPPHNAYHNCIRSFVKLFLYYLSPLLDSVLYEGEAHVDFVFVSLSSTASMPCLAHSWHLVYTKRLLVL